MDLEKPEEITERLKNYNSDYEELIETMKKLKNLLIYDPEFKLSILSFNEELEILKGVYENKEPSELDKEETKLFIEIKKSDVYLMELFNITPELIESLKNYGLYID